MAENTVAIWSPILHGVLGNQYHKHKLHGYSNIKGGAADHSDVSSLYALVLVSNE